MRRRTDVRFEPFRPPRAFRPEGRDLDLTASEDAANLKRLFGADPERMRVAIASGDALKAVAGRTTRPRSGIAVRRLSAWFAVNRLPDVPARVKHPIALQLRYLQTLLEIGGSNSSTIVFPFTFPGGL
jgi:hypothetical protein